MHKIENEFLSVKVREFGAELTSVINRRNGIEHLWQADEKFWGWHAPVLFPVVGRCLNDEMIVDGTHYAMEKHGFARKRNFRLMELNENKIVFSLSADEETRKLYPFEFEFLIGYRLDAETLVCSYEVINKDNKPLLFSLGGHPAFSVPFNAGDNYNDYYIEFEHPETSDRYYIDADGFFNGQTEQVLNNSNVLPIVNGMFDADAYIFKDLKSRRVTIRSSKNPHFLSVGFEGFNYLGLWAKTGAPYVCIEPWLGCADTAGKVTEYAEKEGVIKLNVGQKFNREITVKAG